MYICTPPPIQGLIPEDSSKVMYTKSFFHTDIMYSLAIYTNKSIVTTCLCLNSHFTTSLYLACSLDNENKDRGRSSSEIPLSHPGHASFLSEAINQAKTSRLPTPAADIDAPTGRSACCADTTLNDPNIWKNNISQ